MEVLTFNNTPFCSVCLNRKLVIGNWNLCHTRLSNGRKHKVMCARIDVRIGWLRFSQVDKFLLGFRKHGKCSPSVVTNQRFKNECTKVYSRNCDNYVIGEEDVGKNAASDESTSKVLISGLPDASTSELVASISSCFWEGKPKLSVHYEKVGSENVKSSSVLFLASFGIGSFRYEKQLKNFGRDYRIWAIDFLRQGLSLPVENPTMLSPNGNTSLKKDILWGFGDEAELWASDLAYSIDLWQDQVRHFIKVITSRYVCVLVEYLLHHP